MDHLDHKLPYAVIVESMGLALMAVDTQCRIIRFNGPAQHLTGFCDADVMGRPCSDVLRASLCDGDCPVQKALRTGATSHYGTVVMQTAREQVQTVEVTASALLDETGAIIGAVGIFRDVSQDPGQVRIYGSRVFVSRTLAMRRVFDALPKLASSPAPLLIVGGPGSGRSALAETIHTLGCGASPRPLFTIRCSGARANQSLTEALQTGGHAAVGTVLLEDICAASVALQQRLLGWIEEGGEGLPFRLMSTATDRLERCLRQGVFRRDLFYRLNVLHVVLPTLRERAEDIPLLVAQFVEDLNLKRGRDVAGLTPEAMARLLQTDFPGNVRQLRMVVDHAHAACSGAVIDVEHLPDLSLPWQKRKARLEFDVIRGALEQAGGSITRAAEALRMHRTTLWRKIKQHGLKV